jgi:Kef-type K+ transport system membrane component KefB/mannitol/fructose-specific phosphotransferase system IIA component (Ntr-type)/nucleotide-binding universal stress UspA family protein
LIDGTAETATTSISLTPLGTAAAAFLPSLPITDPVLIVAVSALIFLLAPLLMQRLRLPGLIGLILAGAVVGPNALNLLDRSNTIVLLGTVGLLYLMFMAGIEIDLHEFKRYRYRSLTFGAITFLLPQTIGTAVMLAVGYDLPTSILIASMFASHTLVAYPIALRFGIGKNQAVTTTVGGTIITDTAALLVLAVIAASTEGALDAAFWTRLAIGLAIYGVAVWLGLPRLARWFFRSERTGAVAEYVFVFAALFAGSYLAEVAGVEAIVGAFLVGLALNRLIPEQSVLANRIHFVGDAIFIPFFLVSVGMLVDVRVMLGGLRAWEVMLAMTFTVSATKAAAAWLTGRLFRYSRDEWWTMFGLSVPQAAATLAAALIGVQIGLFDDAVLNGTIMMILVTCILGPWLVERHGRGIALEAERRPQAISGGPGRILVPMANPVTADALMDLALAMRESDADHPIFPLTVVPDDPERSEEHIALAEKMLSHAVAYASALDVPVTPVTRIDHNFANGITRGALETRSTTVVIGWDARRTTRQRIFGTVLDQLLEQTRQNVIVAKLGHPLNTTRRFVLLIPRGSDRIPGFFDMVRAIKLMSNRLGVEIRGYVVGGRAETYDRHLTSVKPDVPVVIEALQTWAQVPLMLPKAVGPDDLVVLMSARRGAVSWDPALERLPALLAEQTAETFLVVYPSEVEARQEREHGPGDVPVALDPDNVLIGLPRVGYERALELILETAFASDRARLKGLLSQLVRQESEFTTEILPGVVVPHMRIRDLPQSMVFLGISRDGVDFPHATAPAHLVFVVLTPEEPPQENLRQLARVARLVRDHARVQALREVSSREAVLGVLAGD